MNPSPEEWADRISFKSLGSPLNTLENTTEKQSNYQANDGAAIPEMETGHFSLKSKSKHCTVFIQCFH